MLNNYIIIFHILSTFLLLQMSAMQRIGQQTQDAINVDDIGDIAYPRLLTIMDGAYGSMQYL